MYGSKTGTMNKNSGNNAQTNRYAQKNLFLSLIGDLSSRQHSEYSHNYVQHKQHKQHKQHGSIIQHLPLPSCYGFGLSCRVGTIREGSNAFWIRWRFLQHHDFFPRSRTGKQHDRPPTMANRQRDALSRRLL